MLICNAGIGFVSHEITKDGFELTFQVNYLGHVYLTKLLLDKLLESSPSRIIFLSSVAHWISFMNKNNLTADYLSPKAATYFTFQIYSNAKMGLNLIAKYLAKKYADKNITTYSVHPGGVRSPLSYRLFGPIPLCIVDLFAKLSFKSPVSSGDIQLKRI